MKRLINEIIPMTLLIIMFGLLFLGSIGGLIDVLMGNE